MPTRLFLGALFFLAATFPAAAIVVVTLPLGSAWLDSGGLLPTGKVPTDGFIDLGLSFVPGDPQCGATVATSTTLAPVTVSVTTADSGNVIEGTVSTLGPRAIWTPAAPLSPNKTYSVAVSVKPSTSVTACVGNQPPIEVTKSFQTATGPATGPPSNLAATGVQREDVCFEYGLEATLTSDSRPYVTFALKPGPGPTAALERDNEGNWTAAIKPFNADACATFIATHTLTGETSSVEFCATSASVIPNDDCHGCASGGAPHPALPLMLLTLFALAWIGKRQ